MWTGTGLLPLALEVFGLLWRSKMGLDDARFGRGTIERGERLGRGGVETLDEATAAGMRNENLLPCNEEVGQSTAPHRV